ncbi:MAG: Mth938-like domain-containing protein [Actinomycetota bacterium]|nr:Mth938-like domain-containing protein [Actinomycetota bacterium]
MSATGSPPITSNSWGVLEVAGSTYKDAKLWPGGACAWDWAETGTAHRPGIRPADVAALVKAGADVVVLSTGRAGRLGVPATTVGYLTDRGVAVEVLATGDAIDRYNALVDKGAAVGALIHSTC